MSILDSKQYKEIQRQGWASVAEGWEKWWKTIEVGADNVSHRLLELAEIKSGSRVLDIATGIGDPAITAARKVGSSGRVLATDISPQMLSIAKRRANSLGLESIIEFKECDAETIDLPVYRRGRPPSILPDVKIENDRAKINALLESEFVRIRQPSPERNEDVHIDQDYESLKEIQEKCYQREQKMKQAVWFFVYNI